MVSNNKRINSLPNPLFISLFVYLRVRFSYTLGILCSLNDSCKGSSLVSVPVFDRLMLYFKEIKLEENVFITCMKLEKTVGYANTIAKRG